jgi:hypothetical protein
MGRATKFIRNRLTRAAPFISLIIIIIIIIILNYKDLTIEIQRMWNVKTKVIPVIIGATGTISKSFIKYVSDIPGNYEVKELQKTAILGTTHILRKVLMQRWSRRRNKRFAHHE